MTRLLHISDLHFGAVDAGLCEPLLALAEALRPDAVIVSGDLTQRAQVDEFRAAADYLAQFAVPVLAVPGNHDAPLVNLAERLLTPFRRYRRHFSDLVEPKLTLPRAVIVGVNTANPLVWKAGRLSPASAAQLAEGFRVVPAGMARVAVLHHAPMPAADGTPADIRDPAGVIADLVAAGVEVVLSGHTHMPHFTVADTAAGILFLQVGTAISTRLKTGLNDVGVVDFTANGATVQSWVAGPDKMFRQTTEQRFSRVDGRWQLEAAASIPGVGHVGLSAGDEVVQPVTDAVIQSGGLELGKPPLP
ncbi:metallophosphoesterase family protein [Tabrizicola sp. BL-A-41-H6]|uniref:metallophosphoesterase family protein n=1 Tax=Tabrizicola sp. BL-A-41-H6 TaxID=3421107 RepID=UPI003D67E335